MLTDTPTLPVLCISVRYSHALVPGIHPSGRVPLIRAGGHARSARYEIFDPSGTRVSYKAIRAVRTERLETARILKRLGDSVQKISQATGLAEDEVEKA